MTDDSAGRFFGLLGRRQINNGYAGQQEACDQ